MGRLYLTILAVIAIGTAPLQARITRIVIDHRDASAYKAQSFGEAGKYERITGHAYGELDPQDPLNAIITDLKFAPRNARGMVEYAATFSMAKPMDMSKAGGLIVYMMPDPRNLSLYQSTIN